MKKQSEKPQNKKPLNYADRIELNSLFLKYHDETAWGVVYDEMVEEYIDQLSNFLKRVRNDS